MPATTPPAARPCTNRRRDGMGTAPGPGGMRVFMVVTPATDRCRQTAGSGAQRARYAWNQPMGGREIGGSGGAGRPLAGIGCGASDNAGPAR
ncbi:hypothetical protein G6F50_018625 [Rhizopus delemar]|uniref:Uncharacterized protein n=1 Tax=Rhizopus delemar TaxID=936053 RepID=A0A9P7BYV7_9FUNG|nr:hypothetical protein G6F50_018625 [Rhizopus delemar]